MGFKSTIYSFTWYVTFMFNLNIRQCFTDIESSNNVICLQTQKKGGGLFAYVVTSLNTVDIVLLLCSYLLQVGIIIVCSSLHNHNIVYFQN